MVELLELTSSKKIQKQNINESEINRDGKRERKKREINIWVKEKHATSDYH